MERRTKARLLDTPDVDSVWDALEDDPVRQDNLKLRTELLITISETIKERRLKQQDAAELLYISQPRVSALLKGKIDEFRLDTQVDLAHRLGLHVSINVAALFWGRVRPDMPPSYRNEYQRLCQICANSRAH